MITRVKKIFSQNGITARIVILFTILVIVPFFIATVAIAAAFQTYVVSGIGETTADSMAVLGEQISENLKKYEEDSMLFYYNNYVEYLNEASVSEYSKNLIETSLHTACFSDSRIHAAYLVTGKEIFHGGAYYNRLMEIMEPYQTEITEAGGKCLWYPTNELLGKEKRNKYILARSLNSSSQKGVGILYFVIDDKIITDAFDQLKSQQSVKYLTAEDGTILYSSNAEEFGKELDISRINPNEINSYEKYKNDSGEYVLVSRHLFTVDWYCISRISMNDSMKRIWRMEFPFLLVAGIYGIFIFIMLYMLRKYIFHPLGILKKNMDQYAQGNLGIIRMEEIGVGEFKSLSTHFNDMTVRISDLMEDYRAEEDEKNRQRMKALTSQLTPHFIYNALNTIKWMAVLNHQDNIQHLTESLVHIFMNAARVDDEKYTLADEIELIKNYAVIQKARFMNFELVIEPTQESLDCCIRKFLIQPIVENAIVHGLGRGKIRNSTISVKTWTMDDCLHVIVRDGGVGFDVEKWRHSPEKDEQHTNIGLHNVEQIIALEYGSPYGLEMVSKPGQGTTMHYILPVISRKEDENDTSNNR